MSQPKINVLSFLIILFPLPFCLHLHRCRPNFQVTIGQINKVHSWSVADTGQGWDPIQLVLSHMSRFSWVLWSSKHWAKILHKLQEHFWLGQCTLVITFLIFLTFLVLTFKEFKSVPNFYGISEENSSYSTYTVICSNEANYLHLYLCISTSQAPPNYIFSA